MALTVALHGVYDWLVTLAAKFLEVEGLTRENGLLRCLQQKLLFLLVFLDAGLVATLANVVEVLVPSLFEQLSL